MNKFVVSVLDMSWVVVWDKYKKSSDPQRFFFIVFCVFAFEKNDMFATCSPCFDGSIYLQKSMGLMVNLLPIFLH